MRLRFEKTRISDEYGKKYNCSDETDMEILCNEVNSELALYQFKLNILESKLEAIKDILCDMHGRV